MQTESEKNLSKKNNIPHPIQGFSKLSKLEKINALQKNYFPHNKNVTNLLQKFWHADENLQRIFDEFSENTLTNYYFPFGVAPNFLINDELMCIPMAIEESSVVAACSKAAKFWLSRGGFQCEVLNTKKIGQVHFIWEGDSKILISQFHHIKAFLLSEVAPLLNNMEQRGGGIVDLKLIDKTDLEPNYYQLWAEFETCDAMGANFINSVLESLGKSLKLFIEKEEIFSSFSDVQIIMAILSNYTPDCLVRARVSCPIEDLSSKDLGMSALEFAEKFTRAVRIAQIDVNRATTHNKGIFNGIDAVVLATGNDFRAVEACGHTYACRDGQYRSLSRAKIENGYFIFEIEIPMSLGTVGGLTALHPIAKVSLEMLGHPSAKKLMEITAAVGLAQNFAAVKSLTTSGIQKGHMKMHLMNILNHLEASEVERESAKVFFADKVISFKDVRDYLATKRNYQ